MKKYKKLLYLWFFIFVNFLIMFFLNEQILTYILFIIFGIILTTLFFLKEKNSISPHFRKALGFSFEVGLYYLIVKSLFSIM